VKCVSDHFSCHVNCLQYFFVVLLNTVAIAIVGMLRNGLTFLCVLCTQCIKLCNVHNICHRKAYHLQKWQ
jgi:hypothetical protein